MQPERWKQVDDLLDAALELEPDKRAAFLDENCAGDEALRKEVETLLASDREARSFIESPALQVAAGFQTDRPARLSSGEVIGPYKILSLLGVGGMGEVYRASDPRIGREVAIKILPSNFSKDPERMRRFEQEARAAGMLNHPNILAIYDVGTEKESPYLVSELLQGELLRQKLKGNPLTVRKAVEYSLQIAQGLSAAHEKGIVHRDLKPENIFIAKDGHVKILDFGLAKLTHPEGSASQWNKAETVDRLTETGAVVGTVVYMSPEQVQGFKVDHRSDIFAFGAVLYEMLSGKRPFRGDSQIEVMREILKADPPELSQSNSTVPPALERIMRRCLEKDPEHRFQSTRDLAFALESLSSPSGAVVPESRPKRAYWLPLLAVLLIGSAIVALAIRQFELAPPIEKSIPILHRLTFRRGTIYSARFVPGSHNFVYSAAWDGNPPEIYTGVSGSAESRSVGLKDAQILSISRSGEMAVLLRTHYESPDIGLIGTLARMPFSGGAPRELEQGVYSADWTPDGKNLAVVRQVDDGFLLEFPLGKVLYRSRLIIRDVRISPTGNRLAFLETRPADYAVIILEPSGSKKVLSSGWDYTWGLAWSPSGDELFFGASKSKLFPKEVYGATLSGKTRLVLPLTGVLQMQDVSQESQLLLVVNSDRTQMSVSPAAEKGERDLSWFDWSWIRDLTNDGKLALFNEIGEGTGGNKDNTYIRNIDSPSAVQLAEANPLELSPDGKWVLAKPSQNTLLNSKRLMLIPIGPAESRVLAHGPIEQYDYATWFPDGKRIAFAGTEKNHGFRIYVQDINGNSPVPITKENTQLPWNSHSISPDSKSIVGIEQDGTIRIYPIEGGEARTIPGLEEEPSNIRGWTRDGSGLYMSVGSGIPLQIYLLNPVSGKKIPWKKLAPADPAGVVFMFNPCITSDGKSYAYSYERILSDLYLIDGFK